MNKKELLKLINDFQNQDITTFDSYCLLNYESIQKIKSLKCQVLEIGAGSGTNSRLLKLAGVDIIPTDIKKINGVEQLDYLTAMNKYQTDALLLIWPDRTDLAYNVLKLFTGKYFIYVGELRDYATANDKFFDLLEKYLENNIIKELFRLPLPAYYNVIDNSVVTIVNYLVIYKKLN